MVLYHLDLVYLNLHLLTIDFLQWCNGANELFVCEIKIENRFIMSFYTKNALDAENFKNRLKVADGLKKG